MMMYNFFVYVSTKEIEYIYYVLYITFIGLTQVSLSGYTFRYIFPSYPNLFQKGIVVFPSLAGIFAILFIKNFLHSKTSAPKLDKLLTIGFILYSIALLLRLFNFDHEAYRMIDISALFSTIITYIVSIKRAYNGYRPAKFFLVAWTMFMTGLILFVFRNLDYCHTIILQIIRCSWVWP